MGLYNSGKFKDEDVIIMGFGRDEFDQIRTSRKEIGQKVFFAAVDAANLADDSYVRLMEMLTIAMRMAYGPEGIVLSPNVSVIQGEGGRNFIFIPMPEAQPIDPRSIYRAQISILHSA